MNEFIKTEGRKGRVKGVTWGGGSRGVVMTDFLCVALAVLKLALYPRLASHSEIRRTLSSNYGIKVCAMTT